MTQLFLGSHHIYHLEALSPLSTLLLWFSLLFVRGSTRFSPQSSLIHSLHYSSQFSYHWFICRSSLYVDDTQNWSTFLQMLSSFIPFTSFYTVLFSYRRFLTSRLKFQTDFSIILVEQPAVWSLRLFVTYIKLIFLSSFNLSFFLKNLKAHPFHNSFPP